MVRTQWLLIGVGDGCWIALPPQRMGDWWHRGSLMGLFHIREIYRYHWPR